MSSSTSSQGVFTEFFDGWLAQQNQDLQSLHKAASAVAPNSSPEQQQLIDRQAQLLLEQIIDHCEYFYQATLTPTAHEFSPQWKNSLEIYQRINSIPVENKFIWICGWRPSIAFEILHSILGPQLESHLTHITIPSQHLINLSQSQLDRIDTLQMNTIQLQREITEVVAEENLVELPHELSQATMKSMEDGRIQESGMEADKDKMRKILERADKLRLDTLKGIVEILRPIQAVHFLIAASDLLLPVHEFIKRMNNAAGVSTVH